MTPFTDVELSVFTKRQIDFLTALEDGYRHGLVLTEVLTGFGLKYNTYKGWKRGHTLFRRRINDIMLRYQKVGPGSLVQ